VVTVGLLADEFRGQVKSVDTDKNTITVADKEGTEKTFTVDKDTKFVKGGKKTTDLPEGIKDKIFTGDKLPKVTITFEKKGDKEVVSEVKVGGMRKEEG
jgi:hypothetical protein